MSATNSDVSYHAHYDYRTGSLVEPLIEQQINSLIIEDIQTPDPSTDSVVFNSDVIINDPYLIATNFLNAESGSEIDVNDSLVFATNEGVAFGSGGILMNYFNYTYGQAYTPTFTSHGTHFGATFYHCAQIGPLAYITQVMKFLPAELADNGTSYAINPPTTPLSNYTGPLPQGVGQVYTFSLPLTKATNFATFSPIGSGIIEYMNDSVVNATDNTHSFNPSARGTCVVYSSGSSKNIVLYGSVENALRDPGVQIVFTFQYVVDLL